MAGQLQVHPYKKTYDELQRSVKRMEIFLDQYYELISDDEKEKIAIMIEGMEKAIRCIPEDYRLTKHHYSK